MARWVNTHKCLGAERSPRMIVETKPTVVVEGARRGDGVTKHFRGGVGKLFWVVRWQILGGGG